MCLTKTMNESEILLRETGKWVKEFLRGRPQEIPERRKGWVQDPEHTIRGSFKSSLPLE